MSYIIWFLQSNTNSLALTKNNLEKKNPTVVNYQFFSSIIILCNTESVFIRSTFYSLQMPCFWHFSSWKKKIKCSQSTLKFLHGRRITSTSYFDKAIEKLVSLDFCSLWRSKMRSFYWLSMNMWITATFHVNKHKILPQSIYTRLSFPV